MNFRNASNASGRKSRKLYEAPVFRTNLAVYGLFMLHNMLIASSLSLCICGLLWEREGLL